MTTTADRLEIEQWLPTSPSLAFESWISPKVGKTWLGPEGFYVRLFETEPKVGGNFRIEMGPPGGKESVHVARGKYLEIVPGRKLAFTWRWDGDGEPIETRVTLEFDELGDGTELKLTQEGFEDPVESKLHEEGWLSALKKLQKHFEKAAENKG